MGAGGDDRLGAADLAPRGLDGGDRPGVQHEAGDQGIGREAHAGGAGMLAIGHGEVVGLQIAVARAPQDGFDVRGQQARPAGLGRGLVEQLDLQPGTPRHTEQAFELLGAGVGQRDPQAADLAPVGRGTVVGLQLREGRDRIHGQPYAVFGAAHLADQTRCLRRGRRCQRCILFEQQHVGLAGLGQPVGDGAADRAAAHDHDLGVPDLHKIELGHPAPRQPAIRAVPRLASLSSSRQHGRAGAARPIGVSRRSAALT